MDVDDPRTTDLRRAIVSKKAFLRRIYTEWHQALLAALPAGDEPVLEVGSGAGFLEKSLPGAITSEVFVLPGVRAVLDGSALPFLAGSLRGIVMTDVLHHVPRPRAFFSEAARCLRAGGVVAMVEPWNTPWSRFVYRYLHHEPFDAQAESWEFPATGPLSGANGALPWILFERDRDRFEAEFPELRIRSITPTMPFSYLFSGGFSRFTFATAWSGRAWRGLETLLRPCDRHLAMFAVIVLEKVSARWRSGGLALSSKTGP